MILKITSTVRCQSRFAAALTLAAMACTPRPQKPDAGADAATRQAVVNAAAECAYSGSKTFRDQVAGLVTATAQYETSGDAATRDAAREAFHAALDAWQVNEAMMYGPAAPSTTPGGNDLRDQIYPWPLVSRCFIEEVMVSKAYETDLRSQLINKRGLTALEYLLFYEGDDTACAATSTIVAQGSWAALTTAERAARRRAYAKAVAADVKAWADDLVAGWEGGFKDSMETPGSSNPSFKSTQMALNLVSDAVFYMDFAVKDSKLARPLGLKDCTADCTQYLESQWAGRSKRNVAQNVIGLRKVLLGCGANDTGTGFDDLLSGVGAGATAAELDTRSTGVLTALQAVEEPDFKEAIAADPPSVEAVLTAARYLTTLLKTDFLTTLDLELPKTLEGDND